MEQILKENEVRLLPNLKCPICGSNQRTFFGFRGPETHSLAKTFKRTVELSEKLKDIKVFNCDNCDLLYCSPLPEYDQNITSIIYDDNYCLVHRPIDPSTKEKRIAGFSNELMDVIKSLDLGRLSGLSYLDVASGGGDMLVAAKKIGLKAEGIDLSTAVCEFAKKNNNVQVHPISIYDPSLDQKSFNLLSLKDILEHVSDPLEFIQRAVNLLAPNGGIYLTCPNEKALVMKLGNIFKGKNQTVNLSPCADPYHLVGFGKKSLFYLFNKVGVEVIKMKSIPVKLKPSGSVKNRLKVQLMNVIDWMGSIFNNGSEFLIILKKP